MPPPPPKCRMLFHHDNHLIDNFAPLPSETLWKLNERREKNRKEEREERGAGGKRREMRPKSINSGVSTIEASAAWSTPPVIGRPSSTSPCAVVRQGPRRVLRAANLRPAELGAHRCAPLRAACLHACLLPVAVAPPPAASEAAACDSHGNCYANRTGNRAHTFIVIYNEQEQ